MVVVLLAVLAFQSYVTRERRAVMIRQDFDMARATAYLLSRGETGLVSDVYSFVEREGRTTSSWDDWRSIRETAWGQLGMREHSLKHMQETLPNRMPQDTAPKLAGPEH